MTKSTMSVELQRTMDFDKWLAVVRAFWVIYHSEPYPSVQVDYRLAVEAGIVLW